MARSDPQINLRIPASLKEALDRAATGNKRSLTAEVVARLQESLEAAPSWARTFPSAAAAAANKDTLPDSVADAMLSLQRLERAQIEDRVQTLEAQILSMEGQAMQVQREMIAIDMQLDANEHAGTVELNRALLKRRKSLNDFLVRIEQQGVALRRAMKHAKDELQRAQGE